MLNSWAMSAKRKCTHCGAEYAPTAPRQVFCNPICSQAADRIKRLTKIEKVCNVCEKTYTQCAEVAKKTKWKSTCRSCIASIQGAEKQAVRQCIVCGKTYTGKTSQTKICSAACKQKAALAQPKRFNNDYTPTAKALQKFGNKFACKTCEFGAVNQHSTTGYECRANARICAPFTAMRLYKEKNNARV